jgi:hypothetical protein
VVVQGRIGECVHGLGNIVTGGLDWDIIIVGEIDTSVLLGGVVGNTEEFALQTGIRRTRDMLAVAPLAISGSSG